MDKTIQKGIKHEAVYELITNCRPIYDLRLVYLGMIKNRARFSILRENQ